MIHKLILRQARSLAASMELHSPNTGYDWSLLDCKTKADFCNIVIAFYSHNNPYNTQVSGAKFINYANEVCPELGRVGFSVFADHRYLNIYDILMRTTACLAQLDAPAFLELFNVEFEGDEVKATLKPEVNWDWAKPEDFE